MSLEKELQSRSESKCELCSAENDLKVYQVPPEKEGADGAVFLCATCLGQMENPDAIDVNHWRCLNDSMWSQVPAVQVLSYRMLKQLSNESWANDLVEMMYMDDETLAWAKVLEPSADAVVHKDSNGVVLAAGDTVVIIKDLKVKGTSFIAKRGTAVRRISLDPDNANHIEGKVDGQHIVILTEFVKKSK